MAELKLERHFNARGFSSRAFVNLLTQEGFDFNNLIVIERDEESHLWFREMPKTIQSEKDIEVPIESEDIKELAEEIIDRETTKKKPGRPKRK